MNINFDKVMIFVFITLYVLVSITSITHLYGFLNIADSSTLSVLLSMAYSLGIGASILTIFKVDSTTKRWAFAGFILLVLMESIGNVYHVFTHTDSTKILSFSELFGLTNYTDIQQRRIFSLVLGLPIVVISVIYIEILGKNLRNKNIPENNELQIENENQKKEIIELNKQHSQLNDVVENLAKEKKQLEQDFETLQNITTERINKLLDENAALKQEQPKIIAEVNNEIQTKLIEFEKQLKEFELEKNEFENAKTSFKEIAIEKYKQLKSMQKGTPFDDSDLLQFLGENAFEGTKEILKQLGDDEPVDIKPIVKTVTAKEKE